MQTAHSGQASSVASKRMRARLTASTRPSGKATSGDPSGSQSTTSTGVDVAANL
jgi:hypothetical protein